MIALIAGILRNKSLSTVEIETAGGLGYEIHIPVSVFEHLPEEGGSVSLHTHLAIREDAWELYGFATRNDRSVFRRLLAAKGVGPSLAMGIISTIGAYAVVDALRDRDVTTLMKVPRVGKRKAEQIILDLADKTDDLVASTSEQSGTVKRSASGVANDAARALTALGYSEQEAHAAVRQVGKHSDVASTVRAALIVLNGG